MNSPQSPGGHRKSWRATQESMGGMPRSRRIARYVISTAVVGLLAVLALLLILPFLNPNVHLVSLPVSYRDLSVPVIAYADEDIDALQQLKDALHSTPGRWTNLKSSAAMKGLGGDLQGLVKSKDVLLFYLNAHGVSEGGDAYLLCSDFDPTRPDVGRYKLEDLLNQISSCPATVKLVILDASRILSDPRLGMVVNEFPLLLEQTVKNSPDSNLWVLSANSMLEMPQVWPSRRNSVFGYFVAEGLKGQADQNENQKVELAELFEYVSQNVSGWVEKYCEGQTQTPVLIRGGRGRAQAEDKLVLLPVPRRAVVKTPTSPDAAPASPAPGASEPEPAKTSRLWIPALSTGRFGLLASEFQQPKEKPVEATSGEKAKVVAGTAPTKPQNSGAPVPKQGKTDEAASAGGEESSVPRAPASSNGPTAGQPESPQTDDPLSLLDYAWKLRDGIETRGQGRWAPSPIDYTPHLWRECVELLLGYEQTYRFGPADSARELGKRLPELMGRMKALAAPSQPLSEPRSSRSLAMAALFIGTSDNPRLEELRRLGESLDNNVLSLSSEDLAKWAVELREPNTQLIELGLAQRLGQMAGAGNWMTIQAALQSTRQTEKAAAYAEWCVPWIRDRIDQADKDRFAGLRELRSGLRQGEQRAKPLLEEARRNADKALEDVSVIAAAIQLRNDLLFRAPYYVQWYAQANLDHTAAVPSYNELSQLLEELGRLTEALSTPNPTKIAIIGDQCKNLERLRRSLEAPLRAEAIDALVRLVQDDPGAKGTTRAIQDRLSTPLLAGPLRMKLLEALHQLPLDFLADPAARRMPSERTPSEADQKRVSQIAQLYVRLAQLANPSPGEKVSTTELLSELQSWVRSPGIEWSQGLRKLGLSLRSFYQNLPGEIRQSLGGNEELTNLDTRPLRMDALRGAQPAAWLADARDIQQLKNKEMDLVGTLRRAQLYDLLAWHSQRFDTARKTLNSPADTEYFASAAEAYRRLANTLEGPAIRGPDTGATPRLVLDGKLSLDLTSTDSDRLDITVEVLNPANITGNPQVTLRFDPALIEIRRSQDNQIITPDEAQTWPALTIKQGASGILQYRLKPKPEPDVPETKLLVQVSAGGSLFHHETVVLLPAPDPVSLAVVPGVAGTAREAGGKTILTPFPNRVNQYRFDLVNKSDKPETVNKVELLAVPRPPSRMRRLETLPFDKKGNLMPGFDSPVRLAVAESPVTIEPKSQTPIAFAPFKAEPPALPQSTRYGLFWLITRENGRKIQTRMDFAPLRPTAYVQVEVGYDRETTKKITVKVKRLGETQLPKEGCKVKVDYEVHPKNAKTGEKKLDGELVAPRFESEMYLQVDPNSKTDVDLRVSVDEYPRAFVYRVNCGETRQGIRPILDHSIRFTAPENGQAFAAPLDSIPAEFGVNAPDYAFESEQSYIEIGIDETRDRQFQTENPLRIFNNRDFEVLVNEVSAEGLISFVTKVGDFKLPLPTGGLSNTQVGVLGIMHLDDDPPVLSEPLVIWLDETPPEIAKLRAQPAPAGQPVSVSVQVVDPESDVAIVEFGFDLEGTGSLTKEPSPVRGKRDEQTPGTYRAELKTDGFPGGLYTVLVRATNKVGISSPYVPVQVMVAAAPKPMPPESPEAKTSKVSGRVLCVDKPVPGCKVKMTGANMFAQTRETDEKGVFVFEKIPAGAYQLFAKGQCNNLERSGNAEIEVLPPKPVTKDIKLQ